MSTTSTTSSTYRLIPNQHDGVIESDPNKVTIKDDVINVDGVTLEGFNPANVSVTRTTMRKVTKITRSRSPSPVRSTSNGYITHKVYDGSQQDGLNRHAYNVCVSETEEEEEVSPPIRICLGQPQVIRPTPKLPGPPTPPKRVHQQYTVGVVSTPPNIRVQPMYSQDDTATVAFSPPPVPPHPESDGEEPPRVPPKPQTVKRNKPNESPTAQYSLSLQTLVHDPHPITRHGAMAYPAPTTNHLNGTPNGTHSSEEWPPPSSQTEEMKAPITVNVVTPKSPNAQQVATPRKFSTNITPALWSPAKTNAPTSSSAEDRTLKNMPAVWSPKGDVTREFKSVRVDLTQPKKAKSPAPPIQPRSSSSDATLPNPEKVYNTFASPPAFSKPASIISNSADVLPLVPNPSMLSKPIQNGHVDGPPRELPSPKQQPPSPKQQPASPKQRPASPKQRSASPKQRPASPKQRPASPVNSSPQHVLPRSLSNPSLQSENRSHQAVAKVSLIRDPQNQSRLELVQVHEVEGNVVHRDRNIHVAPQVQVITDKKKIPKGAIYQKQIIEGDVVHYDTYYPVKETSTTTTTVLHEKPEYSGIGPRDESGLPVGLRQHVKDENRSDWYKQMYKSIHKMDKPEEYNPYNPTYNFPDDNRKSEDGEVVRRRTTRLSGPERAEAQQKSNVQADARNTIDRYQQQPGSILNYVPGKSSLSKRERRNSEGQKFNPPPEETQPHFLSKSQTARKLYAPPPNAYSGPQQKVTTNQPAATTPPQVLPLDHGAYKQLLQGGNIPGRGLRKTSAENLRVDVNANYKGTNGQDKATVERVIEVERQKRLQQDNENQKARRHSDNTAMKSPIITDERFGSSPNPKNHSRSPSLELKAHAIALYNFTAQSPKELSFNKGDIIYLTKKVDGNWYEGEQYGRVGIFPVSYVEIITTLEEARSAQITSPSFEGKAKAKFRFAGETGMELTFKKGDYINLTKKVDNNWWEGRIGKRIGIFPAAYVDVIKEPQGNPVSPVAKQTPSPGRTSPYPSSSSTPHRQTSPQQYGQPIRMQQQQPVANQPKPKVNHEQHYTQPLQNTKAPQSKFVPPSSPTYKVNQFSGHGTSAVTKQPQETYRAIFAYAPQNEDELQLEEGDVILVMEKCGDGWFVGTSGKTGQFGTFPGNYVAKFYPD